MAKRQAKAQAAAGEAERQRLADEAARQGNWKRWGPYLAERQWGTVREDYSADGNVWQHFTHEMARSRCYRWGADGLLGWCDRQCRLCFALALWNEQDAILKERLFGLTGPEGNHGEDVKELYYYLDATPTHSYNRALYKYPQAAFPYDALRQENAKRGKDDAEFELHHTGVFDESRYFDVFAEYAKAADNDTLIQLTLVNRGPEAAWLHVLPTLWFRNTWVWGCRHEGCTLKPRIERVGQRRWRTDHETLEPFVLRYAPASDGTQPTELFTENETNTQRLYGAQNLAPHVRDAFHDRVVHGVESAVNPEAYGTKAAAWYRLNPQPGEPVTLRLRLSMESQAEPADGDFTADFDAVFERRQAEADGFYQSVIPAELGDDQRMVARQAYAGMLWTKQFYNYVVEDWLDGDPAMPAPPPGHAHVRNQDWRHLFSRDVLSMPDKWEYPWFAAWDLAFHMVPLAKLDPEFARHQLILMLREWYMHPNGQIPAYEFAFSDVNPPVHAWACWEVYRIEAAMGGRRLDFLASAFQKLLLNFTWWVNRKDPEGEHLFSGGFLGLDNIGVFDRSQPLPGGGQLNQADGTAWMAFYCTSMLRMALELACESGERAYEDMASKFFEHFVAIVDAINTAGGHGLWDEQDGFYYDQLTRPDGSRIPLKVRSLVGLIPLCAVLPLPQAQLEHLKGFRKRFDWFMANQPGLSQHVIEAPADSDGPGYLLAVTRRARLERLLGYMLDEGEFLSPFGVRSLSKVHEAHPYRFEADGRTYSVAYEPAESRSGMFGGNSNWRGPVWFPINFLLMEALEGYHHFYGSRLTVACPTGSDTTWTLGEVARELNRRLSGLFRPNESGHRPALADDPRYAEDPDFQKLLLFHEYFHGDNGRGCGASHQTGWTGLIAPCLERQVRPENVDVSPCG